MSVQKMQTQLGDRPRFRESAGAPAPPWFHRWISDGVDDGDGEEGGQHDDDHHHGENGRDDEESPGDGEGAEADRDDDDLDAGGADDDGTTSGWVRDPYVQELLLKQTSNARAAAREKAKIAQLEKDAVTPLYEGCRPGDTRLNVTLKAMEMKAKQKLSDARRYDGILARSSPGGEHMSN